MLECFRSEIFHFLFDFRQGCPFDFSSSYHYTMYTMHCSILMEYVRLSWKYKAKKVLAKFVDLKTKCAGMKMQSKWLPGNGIGMIHASTHILFEPYSRQFFSPIPTLIEWFGPMLHFICQLYFNHFFPNNVLQRIKSVLTARSNIQHLYPSSMQFKNAIFCAFWWSTESN